MHTCTISSFGAAKECGCVIRVCVRGRFFDTSNSFLIFLKRKFEKGIIKKGGREGEISYAPRTFAGATLAVRRRDDVRRAANSRARLYTGVNADD